MKIITAVLIYISWKYTHRDTNQDWLWCSQHIKQFDKNAQFHIESHDISTAHYSDNDHNTEAISFFFFYTEPRTGVLLRLCFHLPPYVSGVSFRFTVTLTSFTKRLVERWMYKSIIERKNECLDCRAVFTRDQQCVNIQKDISWS